MPRSRTFDWDEARRLRADGATYAAIAERFGVTDSAVYWACNDAARQLNDQRTSDWQRQGICIDCGGPCTRTGGVPAHRCVKCAAKEAATSVRAHDLQCVTCREWQPDSGFPRSRTEPARRSRHSVCRGCQAAMRRKARHGRRVPCVQCGTPRAHPADRGNRAKRDTGLCRDCYQASRRVAA